MTAAALRTTLRSRLTGMANPLVAAKVRRSVPGASAIGVTVPALKALAAEFKTIPFDSTCDLFDKVCADRVREEILLATFLVSVHRKEVRAVAWARIARWVPALDNWETCDQLASNVAAPRIAEDPDLVEQLVRISGSKDRWQRRFALATASALNQRGRFFPKETIRVCLGLLADPDPMIQTSLAWSIRELSKKDAAIAFEFLRAHRDEISPRTLRDAAAKLPAAVVAKLL